MGFRFRKLPETGDIPSIGLLRGVAASMVVIYHLTIGFPRFLPARDWMRRAGSFGWLGVVIFFVISGFIIPCAMYRKQYRTSDFLIFFKKRLIRIEPPYLLSILWVLAWKYADSLTPAYQDGPFRIGYLNLAGHLAYINAFTQQPWLNPVYWTLAIEFQYYLLIAMAFGWIVSAKSYLRILFFTAFMALSFLNLPVDSYIFSFAGYFQAGILLFQYVSKIISPREFLLCLLITLGVLYLRSGPVPDLTVLFTIIIILYVNEVPRFFSWLGLISYSLYLFHGPVIVRVLQWAQIHLHSVAGREGIVIAGYLLSMLAGTVFYFLAEKKCKALADRIKYRRSDANLTRK